MQMPRSVNEEESAESGPIYDLLPKTPSESQQRVLLRSYSEGHTAKVEGHSRQWKSEMANLDAELRSFAVAQGLRGTNETTSRWQDYVPTARVRHLIRGVGAVETVDLREPKPFFIRFEIGETHRYSKDSVTKLKLLNEQPNYPQVQEPLQELTVGVRVWHASRQGGFVQNVDELNPRGKPFQVCFDDGCLHRYSTSSVLKFRRIPILEVQTNIVRDLAAEQQPIADLAMLKLRDRLTGLLTPRGKKMAKPKSSASLSGSHKDSTGKERLDSTSEPGSMQSLADTSRPNPVLRQLFDRFADENGNLVRAELAAMFELFALSSTEDEKSKLDEIWHKMDDKQQGYISFEKFECALEKMCTDLGLAFPFSQLELPNTQAGSDSSEADPPGCTRLQSNPYAHCLSSCQLYCSELALAKGAANLAPFNDAKCSSPEAHGRGSIADDAELSRMCDALFSRRTCPSQMF